MTANDLKERAIRDPQSMFPTPEAVVHAEELPIEHKRTILQRWRQLIGASPNETQTPSGQPDLATRLSRALAFLDTETGGHTTTHDQGFYTSIGDIGKGETDENRKRG